MPSDVTVWYLELTDPADFRPSESAGPELDIREARVPSPEFSRFLYTAVGGELYWIDRLKWSWAEWLEHLERPGVRTWVAYHEGTPVGYVEYDFRGSEAEIVSFGLLPAFHGRGFGGRLLSFAVEKGWELGAERIWLHTCSLDGDAALPNYQRRGFRLFRTESDARDFGPEPPGPWPVAHRREHLDSS